MAIIAFIHKSNIAIVDSNTIICNCFSTFVCFYIDTSLTKALSFLYLCLNYRLVNENFVHQNYLFVYFVPMHRVLAFFFLFLFLSSTLPLKTLGKSWVKGWNTEQVEDDYDCDEEDDIFKVKHATPFSIPNPHCSRLSSCSMLSLPEIEVLDQVSLYLTIYVSKIPSPPPDLA